MKHGGTHGDMWSRKFGYESAGSKQTRGCVNVKCQRSV